MSKMVRYNNLYIQICSINNLILADKKANKNKSKKKEVIEHRRNARDNIIKLHKILVNKLYNTSKYYIFNIKDSNKIREIFKLPYYPDRIVHHAIMNILEPIFVSVFTVNTFNCIKRRGILGAYRSILLKIRYKEILSKC